LGVVGGDWRSKRKRRIVPNTMIASWNG
jgi:hypothetical protein